MKPLLLLTVLTIAPAVRAQSTIYATAHHSWAGNTGWLDFRPDSTRGFRFGKFSCAG